jgi:hypothetical protein
VGWEATCVRAFVRLCACAVSIDVGQDPAFFAGVVRPYLSCKRTMTFLDDWLLGRDLSPYLSLHRFTKLNAAEQALLCGRLGPATGVCGLCARSLLNGGVRPSSVLLTMDVCVPAAILLVLGELPETLLDRVTVRPTPPEIVDSLFKKAVRWQCGS